MFMCQVVQACSFGVIMAKANALKIQRSIGKLVRCVKLGLYCDNSCIVRMHACTHLGSSDTQIQEKNVLALQCLLSFPSTL